MPELLSSKIIISEEEPTVRGFPELPTAVLAIEGIAERGPIAEALLLTAYSEYEKYFGGLINGRELALAVRGFFLNGGQRCYVARTCHFTDPSNKDSATAVKGSVTLKTAAVAAGPASVLGTTTGPWVLEPGDTLIGSVDGLGDQTASFLATPGSITDTTTYPVADQDGLTLEVAIDGGATQVITFSGVTTTAAQIAAQINAQIDHAKAEEVGGQVKISSDKDGTLSSVAIIGGTSALTWAAPVAGGGNVGDIKAVTAAEVETIVEAAWTNGGGVAVTSVSGAIKIATVLTGLAKTLQVQAPSTADTVFGLDNLLHTGSDAVELDTLKIWGKTPGAYVNNLKIKVAAASADVPAGTEPARFNLQVLKGTDVIESYANLTMDTTDDRYVETVINHVDYGSWYVEAEDLSAAGTPESRRPANVSGATPTLGDDGLTGLDDNDYIGTKTAKTGLYAFDAADDITLLACPDDPTDAMQKAMVAYVEVDRNGLVFALLDPQAGLSTTGIIAQWSALGSEGRSEHAALYWPRIIIANPNKTVFGANVLTITVCPTGYIAGIMARNDRNYTEGPFFQPAGTDGGKPYGVVGLETEEVKFEEKRDLVFPKRIDPITYLRGYGIFVDGARTLKGDGNFPSIGERRGVSLIESLLIFGLQWVRLRNKTPNLRQQVNKEVYSLLHGWMRRGAFASNDPATAFFVDTSDALNPPSVVRSGQLVIRVGMATNSPAEFIIIKVTKDTRALEAELFGTAGV